VKRRRGLCGAVVVLIAVTASAAALAASTNFYQPASSPEAAGTYPASITAADLDGDGDADLAVANYGSNDVTILKNNGAGKFKQPASSPVAAGANPISVAAADLDGDGDSDLAVANQFSNDVTILKNNGAGKFKQPAAGPVAAGDGPASVAAADLDGDGDSDLAVANNVSNDVTILKNNGAGKFKQPASSPVAAGSAPISIAAADLDATGDGDRDLAVANFGSNDVTILKNNGAGDFSQPGSSPEAVGANPISVAAADLDGDGDRDLAVANASSNEVMILQNAGAGDFSQPGSSPEAAGSYPISVAAADLDGDDDSDLAVANLGSNDVTILKNSGAGDFSQPGSSPEAAGTTPYSIAAADLDGDGDRDLGVANFGSDDVTILKNR
jgi:hypothetical protein